MAYAALLSLQQTIAHILNHDSYSISPHQKKQIISMNKNVTLLKEFLEGSSEKADNVLEGQMRDLANEVENIMEYFMWRRIRYRHINWITKAKFKSELNKAAVQVETMAAKVSDRIREVWLDDDDYSAAAAAAAATSSSRLAPSYKHDVMVGFEGDLLAIKERLCGDQSSKLKVIPIVGMGGIGKTTLATNAYLDPLIIEHFHIRAWVTVSQDYSAQRIVSELLCSVKELDTERTGLGDEEKVYKSLKGRRYLIVIDDIWSREAWDDIKMIFPNENNGSRVIITTRLLDVASYADSSSPLHEMHLMDKDQSWNLLRQQVFNQETCPLELEKIGKMIARSCKGLPLGIVVIGGLLSTVSKTRASWEEIAENVKSAISTTKDGQIEKILSLSYTHLPHHLRPCFLYMAAFPGDYGIRVSKIIKLWISEGFIKPSVSRSIEEEAEEYFEDLVKRSLVMVTKRKCNGKIKSCRLHDVMRELCIEKAQQDKFLQHVTDREVHSKRRICIIQSNRNRSSVSAKTEGESNFNCLANIYGLGIHTIICFRDSEWSSWKLKHFRFLRVLDLEFSNFDFSVSSKAIQLPDQVFELFHLRYLAFGYTMHVPPAISNLKNLQTLIMHPRKIKPRFESSKLCLSSEIWNMPELRHLVSHCLCLLGKPEEGASSHVLECLQTLWMVENLKFTESIIKTIPNVTKLGLFYVGSKENECYQLENLVHLKRLEKLKLTVHVSCSFPQQNASLALPGMLKKLNLSGERLPWEHIMRIVGLLPKLQVLKLRNPSPDWDQWQTSEGEFPELKYLLIENSDLKHWITESSHFPSLKCLLLHNCPELTEIPDGIGEILSLELIEVKSGSKPNKSLEESAKRIQEEQQSWGNDVLQVRCIPYAIVPRRFNLLW